MTIEDLLELKQQQKIALDRAIGVYLETHRKYREGYEFSYHNEVATVGRAYAVLDLSGIPLYIRYSCFISSWHSPDDIDQYNVLVPEFAIDKNRFIEVNESVPAIGLRS